MARRRARARAAAAAGALFAGCVLTLAALEGGLRLAGLFAGRRPAAAAPGAWTVLCIGDSFTFTGGGESYPDQLSRRLGAEGVEARVLNRGIPGLNSNLLAGIFEAELEKHKPDAAIVLIGADNFWTNLPVREEPPARRIDRALLSLKTWKLLKLLWVGISEGTLRGHYRAMQEPRGRKEAVETVRAASERQLEHPDDLYRLRLGEAPEAPRVEAAARALAALLTRDPGDDEARRVLGEWQLAQGQTAAAERTFRAGGASCEPALWAGLAKALDRMEGEAAAARALAASDESRCPGRRALAEGDWRLWRGDAREAAAIARAAIARDRNAAGAYYLLGRALYQLEDFDGAVAAYREHARLDREEPIALGQALLHQWSARRRKDPKAPMPGVRADDMAYAWIEQSQDWPRCAAAAREGLKSRPLDASLFYTYASCLWRARRFDEAARLADEVPAVRGNLFYRYYEAQRARAELLRRPREELEREQFRADMERIVAIARAHGVALVLGGYPEEEYEPVKSVAKEHGLPYADFPAVFRARFKDRSEFLDPDRCHCDPRGFAVIAEGFHELLKGLPGYPGRAGGDGGKG